MLDGAFDLHFDEPVSVKIRFSEEQARYIEERQWATGQEIEPQPDGSIILSMTTSGWWDVKKWILSYGSHAELLEPEDLRNHIRDELQVAAGLYKSS
jgi:predicted DNA-binding transcriptional regulator YafY